MPSLWKKLRQHVIESAYRIHIFYLQRVHGLLFVGPTFKVYPRGYGSTRVLLFKQKSRRERALSAFYKPHNSTIIAALSRQLDAEKSRNAELKRIIARQESRLTDSRI